jgi:flagellar basal body-associated protein FliL
MPEVTTPNTNKPAAPAGKYMNPIIVGTFAFLITVVIAGTILIITFKAPKTVTQTVVVKEGAGSGEIIGPLVPLGNEIIVNLTSEEGTEHYLKVNVTLEVENEKVKEEAAKRIPQIRDQVISILRSKTKEKIDQKEGKDLVRSEIIKSINSFLVLGKVKNVFFEDFVIQ